MQDLDWDHIKATLSTHRRGDLPGTRPVRLRDPALRHRYAEELSNFGAVCPLLVLSFA
jgi:hypothetical protein